VKLVTALLVKDEASRDLGRVLRSALYYSDVVLVLDDQSHDDSPKIARSLGCVVKERSILAKPAWGNEAPARKELWDFAAQEAGDGWVLFCDADQILHGDPRPYTKSWDANTVCLPLYDLWDSEETFRADGYWTAYQVARPWMVRPQFVPDGWAPQWGRDGLHVGHLPSNWVFLNPIVAPDLYFAHYAYLTPERRKKKHEQYLSKKELLSPQEIAHAMSIIE
jgi:hypothetical protein